MKDLKIVSRPSRKKPGMKEFFIFILCYSYYNRSNEKNEFALSHQALADYYECTTKTIYRWMSKLHELGYLQYAKREDAGKVGQYVKDGEKHTYIIPPYKKIRVGKENEIKFVNIYTLDQKGLNSYLIDKIDLDILTNIKIYKEIFNSYIRFLTKRGSVEEILKKDEEDLTKEDKNKIKRSKNIENKIIENEYYLKLKEEQDKLFPEFQCKYLKEGCLRLTHEICNTVNPEHIEKINENNYWRSSHARNDMLKDMLGTTDVVERDVNGSIYRLTYNLYHDEFLSDEVDIYKLIWKYAFKNIDLTDYVRNKFKKLIMPIYMREYSMAYTLCEYQYIDKYFEGHPRKYAKLDKGKRERYELLKLFTDYAGCDIIKFIEKIKYSMHKVLNTDRFLGPDIFIYESNLHILIKKELLNRGIKCVNIYDGFYFENGIISQTEFNQIYKNSLTKLKLNLSLGIGKPL